MKRETLLRVEGFGSFQYTISGGILIARAASSPMHKARSHNGPSLNGYLDPTEDTKQKDMGIAHISTYEHGQRPFPVALHAT